MATTGQNGPTGDPRCPLCGGPLDPPAIEGAPAGGKSYGVRMCGACAVGVTVPVPSPDDLATAYSEGSYRAGSGARFNPLVERIVRLFRTARRRRIERFVRSGRVLDIGCGRGLFLHVMRRSGWETAGIEVDERTAQSARETYGVDVRSGDPESWGFADGSFDVVVMNHSLEHVRDPAAVIARCRALLRPGGLFLVAVPDIGSVQARAGGRLWFHLDPPYHLHHFTEEGLSRHLEANGFRVVRVRRFDLEYNPYGWLQTLLNLAGIRKNLLFDRLKGRTLRDAGGEEGSAIGIAMTLLLLPAFAPLSFALCLYESFVVRKGGTVEIFAIRR